MLRKFGVLRLWDMLPEPMGTYVECLWLIYPDDGNLVALNPNAVSVLAQLMK